ncbi:hypothetical protein Tco_0277697 [Tanacetum coccineum]
MSDEKLVLVDDDRKPLKPKVDDPVNANSDSEVDESLYEKLQEAYNEKPYDDDDFDDCDLTMAQMKFVAFVIDGLQWVKSARILAGQHVIVLAAMITGIPLDEIIRVLVGGCSYGARSFQNFMSQADPETLTSTGHQKNFKTCSIWHHPSKSKLNVNK